MIVFEGALSYDRAMSLPLVELMRLAREYRRYTDEINRKSKR